MIVWTIQPFEVYQKILDKGCFYCDPNRSINLRDDLEFQHAYKWMIQQMVKKIGTADKMGAYPVWAWYRSHDYKHQRPDFRWTRDYPDEVCIEIEIPESQVLLSDFEGWHFVLNDWFYSDATSQEEWDRKEQWFDDLNANQQQRIKSESWQRIFDITPRHGEWKANGESVQACFWSIKKDQIRKVWRLQKGKKVRLIKKGTQLK